MRTLVFATLISLSSSSIGQSSFDSLVSKAACNCITQLNNYEEESLSNCIVQGFKANTELLLKECLRTYGDTSDLSAHKLGMNIYRRLSVSMVFSCDAYYKIFDTLRNHAYADINMDSAKKSLDTMLARNPQKPSAEFYNLNGIINFKELNFGEAIRNFNQAIELSPKSFQSIFFKAWALENTGDYDESISLYKKLAIVTGRYDFNIFAAMAERKKNGL